AAQQRHFFNFAVIDADEVAGGVQNLREDVLGQAFGGEQVNQLAVLIELGIALVQHVYASLTSKWKVPSSLRARASDWLAGSATRAAANSAATGSSRPPRSTSTA